MYVNCKSGVKPCLFLNRNIGLQGLKENGIILTFKSKMLRINLDTRKPFSHFCLTYQKRSRPMSESILNKINWLGHDCFRIDSDKVIYIDPYQIEPGIKADIILITHEHFDHCSLEDIEKIRTDDTLIITEKDSAKKLSGNVQVMKPGETTTVDGIKIETVPAYNLNKEFHPKENGWLGFIIEIDGERIYHSGDADYIPEMEGIKADIALLPVSGTYVMTAEEAVKAALTLKPTVAIPMHYGSIVGSLEDAQRFEQALQGQVLVKILEKV